MARLSGLRRFVRIDRSRGAVDRAVDDELQFHFDMTTRDLMANGMSPDEARREAERRFGDVRRTRERLSAIDRAREGSERRAEWWGARTIDRPQPASRFADVAKASLGLATRRLLIEAARAQLGDGHVEVELQLVVDGAVDRAARPIDAHEPPEAVEARHRSGPRARTGEWHGPTPFREL